MEVNYKDKFENLQMAVNQFFATCNPESDLQALIAENEILKKKLQRRDQEIKRARKALDLWRDQSQKNFNEAESLRRQIRQIQKGDCGNEKKVARLTAENETLWDLIRKWQIDYNIRHNNPSMQKGNCKVMSIKPLNK